MKGRKTWQRGYAAGLIDGEGCIAIRKVKPTKNNRQINACYQLQVSMNMIDGGAIDFMVGTFGGHVYAHKASSPERLNHWRWEIISGKAMVFLKQILPFLKCKKTQAELGIRFQLCKRKVTNQHDLYTKEELNRMEWYYREMRSLKNIHIPCAAATTNRIGSQNVGSDSLVLQEKQL